MRTLLSAAVLLSASIAQALPARSFVVPVVHSQVVAQTADEDEDEETGSVDEASEEAVPAPAAPSTATEPVAEPATASRPRGELVSGAPLANPDVAVHIVERKRFSDKGRHEVTLYPVVPQANGKFTHHLGSAVGYQYHVQENFGLQLGAQYNWVNDESGFNTELVNRVKQSAQAASSLLATWGAYAGFEVVPIYGKFAFYEDNLAQFSVVLNAGAGLANTRHRLMPPPTAEDTTRTSASFGDTGIKFLGEVGGGFRVQLGDRFALRLEVRDLIYTARVDQVNGCNLADIEALMAGASTGGNVSVSGGCRPSRFDEGGNRGANLVISRDLVREPSSDAINLINFYAGASYLF